MSLTMKGKSQVAGGGQSVGMLRTTFLAQKVDRLALSFFGFGNSPFVPKIESQIIRGGDHSATRGSADAPTSFDRLFVEFVRLREFCLVGEGIGQVDHRPQCIQVSRTQDPSADLEGR